MQKLEGQIKILVELQTLDSQILKQEDELANIPELIKKIGEVFQEKASNLKRLEEELKSIILKRKEKEGDLAQKEGNIKKQQSQQYQVKTNKEYTAIEQEISRAKADNSLIEEEILKLFDLADAQNKKIAQEKEALKTEEVKSVSEKKIKMEESKKIESELASLKALRNDLVSKVDKAVLSRYEKILSNKSGLAVVPIINESCQGCFRVLPPQAINEVRMMQDIVLCDNCSRILYIEP